MQATPQQTTMTSKELLRSARSIARAHCERYVGWALTITTQPGGHESVDL